VWNSNATKTFITNLLAPLPEMEKDKVIPEIEHLLNSMNLVCLDAKEAGNMLKLRFNVHTDSTNFSYNKIWTNLRTYLANRIYASSLEGQGNMEQVPFRCTCCHSVDHPRGLCPFPSLTGWNGPKKDGNGETQRRNDGTPDEQQDMMRVVTHMRDDEVERGGSLKAESKHLRERVRN
jgi:hypothetical protein